MLGMPVVLGGSVKWFHADLGIEPSWSLNGESHSDDEEIGTPFMDPVGIEHLLADPGWAEAFGYRLDVGVDLGVSPSSEVEARLVGGYRYLFHNERLRREVFITVEWPLGRTD